MVVIHVVIDNKSWLILSVYIDAWRLKCPVNCNVLLLGPNSIDKKDIVWNCFKAIVIGTLYGRALNSNFKSGTEIWWERWDHKEEDNRWSNDEVTNQPLGQSKLSSFLDFEVHWVYAGTVFQLIFQRQTDNRVKINLELFFLQFNINFNLLEVI